MYRVGSLFTGIGGIDLAFERAGFQIAFQVEIDDYCNRVLERHWPHVERHRDVRECGAANLPAVDVLAGGFPCQDISNAGQRKGIQEGTRSGLWIEFARIIGEIRPRIVLLENVAAITSRDGTRVVADLAALGYSAEWGIVPASSVGAPHQRDRWWCVAYAEGQRGAAWRTERQPQRRHTLPVSTGSEAMGNTTGEGLSNRRRSDLSAVETQNGARLVTQSERPGEELVNANYERRKEQQRPIPAAPQFNGPQRSSSGLSNADSEPQEWSTVAWRERSTGAIEPGFRRVFDGLPGRLDRIRRESQWPARPSEPQYRWESPRTASGIRNRVARLKALGNAVVPQVVQPIAESIHAFLTEADSAGSGS